MLTVKNARLCARCREGKHKSNEGPTRSQSSMGGGPVHTCLQESVPGARTKVLEGLVGQRGQGQGLSAQGKEGGCRDGGA